MSERAGTRTDLGFSVLDPPPGMIIVVPSLNLPAEYEQYVPNGAAYEERLLFFLLLLSRSDLEITYLSTVPMPGLMIDFYLRMLPDPEAARRRLHLLVAPNPGRRCYPAETVGMLRRLLDRQPPESQSWLFAFHPGDRERALAEIVDVPLYGSLPEVEAWGTKSAGRHLARTVGVPIVDGFENVRDIADIEDAIGKLFANTGCRAFVVKLNTGLSGIGNAVVTVRDPEASITAADIDFGGSGMTWGNFADGLRASGGVVERLLPSDHLTAPSCLLEIRGDGTVNVLGTHEQMVSGRYRQSYMGCRFPADPAYRSELVEYGRKVGKALAARGALGLVGIDFLANSAAGSLEITLCEINLRAGGTTHPLALTRYLCASHSSPRYYIAVENLTGRGLPGRRTAEILAMVADSGLGFDPRIGTGVIVHMASGAHRYGKIGVTCIAESVDGAEQILHELSRLADT